METPNIVNFEQWVTSNYIKSKNPKHVFKILTRLYDQAYADELAMMAKLNGEAPSASSEEVS
jgi:hypothetical protein